MAMLALLSPERLDHVDDGSWLVIMPHLCQYCGKASSGEAQLARHIRSNHLDSYRFQLQLQQGAQFGIVHELPPGLSTCQI